MCENVYELGHDKKARKTRRARHQIRNYVTARGFARFKASDGRKFEVYKSFKTFRQPLLHVELYPQKPTATHKTANERRRSRDRFERETFSYCHEVPHTCCHVGRQEINK